MAQLDKFIEAAFKRGGERLVIAAGEKALYFKNGSPQSMTSQPATSSQARNLLLAVLPAGLADRLESGADFEFTHPSPAGPVEVRVTWTGAGLRCEVVRNNGGEIAGQASTEQVAAMAAAVDSIGTTARSPAAVGVATLPSPGTGSGAPPSPPAATAPQAAIPVAAADPGAEVMSAAAGSEALSSRTREGVRAGAGAPPEGDPRAPVHGAIPGDEARGGALPAASSECRSRMEGLLRRLVEEGCSDLHLSSSTTPCFRKDGDIVSVSGTGSLSPDEARDLVLSITPEKYRRQFEEGGDTDFAHEIEGLCRFRCNVFMDRLGPGGVFRVIPSKIPSAEDLRLPPSVLELCELSKGLVLVTGPTGSGKSTTLAAMLGRINATRSAHIITIEDPIEFVHPNRKCLVNQREVGVHTAGFKVALRAALREDPDIVLVGEMRDLETVAIAIETAETGHLVLGTLHTSTAASTVDRIIDQFPSDRQGQIRMMLAESLKGVISQVLCKKKGGGRVAALEILLVTPAMSNLIREEKTFQIPTLMQTGKGMGMMLMNDALVQLVQEGLVEPREALDKAPGKAELRSALERTGIRIS